MVVLSPERIFVRAPNWVGDLVMATASFERLRRGYPDARITVGCRGHLATLLGGNDWFDAVEPTPKAGGLRGLRRQAAWMRAQRFDLAVVFPNSLETGLVPFLAGVPHRLGYRQGRPGLMNLGRTATPARQWWQVWRHGPRRVPVPMPQYYEALLDVLELPRNGHHPRLTVTGDARARVDRWLRERGVAADAPLLLLTAGASFGASKLWMPERFAAVGRHFRDVHGMVPIVLAGPAEVELAERIAAEIGPGALPTTDPVIPLDELEGLVERARLMITGDTGPRHLGVAFDLPVVVLMGPNDRRYTDYCLERQTVVRVDLECSPCQRQVCPLGHHRCMRDITVDDVVAAGETLLVTSVPRTRPSRS